MANKKLQTLDSIRQLISKIECGGYDFIVKEYKGIPFLQIEFDAPCTLSGVMERQYCRKWVLQYEMCDSEVIRTAHLAARQAAEHEIDESFKFENERIYNPHHSVYYVLDMIQNHDDISDKRVAA